MDGVSDTLNSTPTAKTRASWNPSYIAVIVLAALVAGLVFISLGHGAFWDDESFVGIVARNLLNSGHLSVWDGRNIYAPGDGYGLTSDFRNLNPPLDSILVSISFKLLGISNFSARLPFALSAVAELIVLVCLLRRIAPCLEVFHLYCAATLVFSVAFLLYARNCRYYELSMLLATATYLAYRKFIVSYKISDLASAWALAALLFYCHYMVCGAFLIALAAAHFIFHPKAIVGKQWVSVGLAILLLAAVTVPYAIASHIQEFSYGAAKDPWIVQRAKLIWWNFRDTNLSAVFPWMLAALLFLILARMRVRPGDFNDDDRTIALVAQEFAALCVGYVVVLGILSPQPTDIPTVADIRYQAPIIPFLAIMTGCLLWFIHKRAPIAAVAVLLATVCTNIFTLVPFSNDITLPYTGAFRWLLPDYVREIAHPYPTANAEVAAFLRANANQDDSVINIPTYEDYPMMYYIGDKIKVCCQLDHSSPIPESVVAKMNAPMYYEDSFPDWIVAYAATRQAQSTLDFFSRPHSAGGRTVAHSYRLAKLIDVFPGQSNRPELPWHHFGPIGGSPGDGNAVYIFHATPDIPVNP